MVSSHTFVSRNPETKEKRKLLMRFKSENKQSRITIHRSLTFPLKLSVFSMYVSAICKASRILGATEKR